MQLKMMPLLILNSIAEKPWGKPIGYRNLKILCAVLHLSLEKSARNGRLRGEHKYKVEQRGRLDEASSVDLTDDEFVLCHLERNCRRKPMRSICLCSALADSSWLVEHGEGDQVLFFCHVVWLVH